MFEWLQPLINWLQQRFDDLAYYLNPSNWIAMGLAVLVSYLPEPSPAIDAIITRFNDAMHLITSYLVLADYFIDVKFLLKIAALMVASEFILAPFRLWRTARSAVI